MCWGETCARGGDERQGAASFDGDGLRLGKVRTELKFSLAAPPAGCSRFRKMWWRRLAERVAFWNDMDTAVVQVCVVKWNQKVIPCGALSGQ